MISNLWVKRIGTAIDEVIENTLDNENMYDYHEPVSERLNFLHEKLVEEQKSGRNPKTAALRLRSISRSLDRIASTLAEAGSESACEVAKRVDIISNTIDRKAERLSSLSEETVPEETPETESREARIARIREAVKARRETKPATLRERLASKTASSKDCGCGDVISRISERRSRSAK